MQSMCYTLSEVCENQIVEDLCHTNELCEYGPNNVFGIGPSRIALTCSFPKEQVTVLPVAPSGAVTFICCGQTAGPLWLAMTHGLLPRSATNAASM